MTDTAPTGELQALVLRSVLTGQPVPGTSSPARLADLGLATTAEGAVRVLTTGLAPAALAEVTSLGGRALPVDAADLAALQQPAGLVAALRVRETEATTARVRVTAEVCGLHAGRLHPLGASSVVFVREGEGWVAAGPPTELAT